MPTILFRSCWVPFRKPPFSACILVIAWRGTTTHSGVDVNNTHLSMINPLIITWYDAFLIILDDGADAND